ncbi:hypothetical protein [Dietzia sp. 179-F 9C3 NHS]|uniref:hypothetical protein n=1 Tax=Dietzia sp. 179-F 9C3 NHS TaxID=3374295 RepID=UPI00387A2903
MRQLPQPDVRGWLAFTGLPADVQAAEDATAAADYERSQTGVGVRFEYNYSAQLGRVRSFRRPATDTERHLLALLGHQVPDELDTFVHHYTQAVRHRFWPDLEED